MRKFNLVAAPFLCAAAVILMAGIGLVIGRSGLAASRTESRTTIEPVAAKTRITVTIAVEGDPDEVSLQVRKMLSVADQTAETVDLQ